jgi:hypothetical protein
MTIIITIIHITVIIMVSISSWDLPGTAGTDHGVLIITDMVLDITAGDTTVGIHGIIRGAGTVGMDVLTMDGVIIFIPIITMVVDTTTTVGATMVGVTTDGTTIMEATIIPIKFMAAVKAVLYPHPPKVVMHLPEERV